MHSLSDQSCFSSAGSGEQLWQLLGRARVWARAGRRRCGCSCTSNAIALALGSRDDLLTEHLIFHAVGDSLVEAATVIFQKLFACCQCLEFKLYYRIKCNPTAAFWRVGFSLYPIILYSLKIRHFNTSCFLPLPLSALGFCAG